MTSPLREMTAAARAMAEGDYSRRVRATSRDEVGQLATAFNIMAEDLASVDQTAPRADRERLARAAHPGRRAQRAAREHRRRRGRADPGRRMQSGARADRAADAARHLPAGPVPDRGRGRRPEHHRGRRWSDFLEDAASAVSMVDAAKQLRSSSTSTPEDLTVHGRPRTPAPGGRQPAAQRDPALPARSARSSIDGAPAPGRVVFDVTTTAPGSPPRTASGSSSGSPAGAPGPTGRRRPAGPRPAAPGSAWRSCAGRSTCTAGTVEVADTLAGATMRVALPAAARGGRACHPPDSDVRGRDAEEPPGDRHRSRPQASATGCQPGYNSYAAPTTSDAAVRPQPTRSKPADSRPAGPCPSLPGTVAVARSHQAPSAVRDRPSTT